MPDTHAHAPATSCLPARHWTHPRAPRTPQASHSLPELLSSSGSLARSHRTHPPPPTSFLAATATPSPLRRAPELRCSALVLLVISRDQKGPEQPTSSSSPSFGPGAVLRRIRPLRRAPELADPPCTIPVSSTPFPLLHFVRSRAVAPRPHSRAPPSAMDAGHGTDVLLRPVRRA